MNTGKFLYNSRGIVNLIPRIASLFVRFRFTSHRMEEHLQIITDICKSHGFLPTFPITAMPLSRHPKFIKRLQEQGVEFAIHGLTHTDYTQLPLDQHYKHFKKAIDIFKQNGIQYTGFRAPYLRANDTTLAVVAEFGFSWDSNVVVDWPVVSSSDFTLAAWEAYQKVLALYKSKSAQAYRAIPRARKGFVEIPVSIPDDEACVDRLGIKNDKKQISNIWHKILEGSYARGELFTVQMHHERLPFCDRALEEVLNSTERFNPPVFKANISTIVDWWNKRSTANVFLEGNKDGYSIRISAPREATILCRGIDSYGDKTFLSNYYTTNKRSFLGKGILPGIALSNSCHPSWEDFVRQEGFILLSSIHYGKPAYVIDIPEPLNEPMASRLIRAIDSGDFPLIRLWRWPHECQSALTVTGDIDCLTLQDFLFRLLGR